MLSNYDEKSLYTRYPMLKECEAQTEEALKLILETYRSGGKILLCGNGGSCADCDHIVGELMKSFMLERKPSDEVSEKLKKEFDENADEAIESLQCGIPAISLPSQAGVLTAYLNDVKPEYVYAQLVFGYGRKGDLLIGLSTSGNAKNVTNAVKTARALGLKTLSITGKNESNLSRLCDVCVKVPETETYKIQELTLPVYHHLCAMAEKIIFGR